MKPVLGMVADLHLCDERIGEVSSAFKKAVSLCVEKECSTLFILGDIFDSRKALSFHTLHAFGELLDFAYQNDILIEMFPGNHDKISYTSEKSYLDIYRHHPTVNVYTDYTTFRFDKFQIHILPFFEESTIGEHLQNITQEGIDILFTHIAIDGVRNNDGGEVKGVFSRDTLKEFDRVYVGHYHDKQEIGNVLYIGSIIQKDYGENDGDKGITFLYNDMTEEQISLGEKKYLTVDVDLSRLKKEEIKDTLVDIYKNAEDNIRFRFIGKKEELKLINREEFLSVGIDVSYKEVESVSVTEDEVIEFGGFDRKKILSEWKGYCKGDREKYLKPGEELLTKI